MKFDLTILTHNAGAILGGFAVTLETWITGVLIGILAGLAIALLQLSCGRAVSGVLRAYIEVVRGTPLAVSPQAIAIGISSGLPSPFRSAFFIATMRS